MNTQDRFTWANIAQRNLWQPNINTKGSVSGLWFHLDLRWQHKSVMEG